MYLRDSSGVFVESCKFHTRNPIAAAIQLRELKTTQSLGDYTTSLQLADMAGIKQIMKKFEKLDVDKNKSSTTKGLHTIYKCLSVFRNTNTAPQLKEFTLFTMFIS